MYICIKCRNTITGILFIVCIAEELHSSLYTDYLCQHVHCYHCYLAVACKMQYINLTSTVISSLIILLLKCSQFKHNATIMQCVRLNECCTVCAILFLFQVVGGMVWCISVCSYDVDVDLLFQENSSIGQKMFVLVFYNLFMTVIS